MQGHGSRVLQVVNALSGGSRYFNGHAMVAEPRYAHIALGILITAILVTCLSSACILPFGRDFRTMETPRVGTRLRVGIAACIAALPCLLDGVQIVVASGVLFALDPDEEWHLALRAAIVGAFQIGQIVSVLFWPRVADGLGRKAALQIAAAGQLVALIVMAMYPHNLWVLIGGRVVSGIFFGQMVSALYISENTPDKLRGFAVSYVERFVNLGSLIGFCVFFWWSVRTIWTVFAWLAGVNFVLICFLPEVVARAMPVEAPEAIPTVLSSGVKRGIFIACMLGFFQQSSGEEALFGWATHVADEAGLARPLIFGVILAFITLLCNIFASLVFDSFGRRTLLICGMFAMGICWALAASLLMTDVGPIPSLAFVLLLEVFYATSIGPGFLVVASEVLPDYMRASGLGYALFVSRVTACIMVLTFEFLTVTLTMPVTFFILAAIMVCGSAFAYFYVPETRGKSFKRIQKILEANELEESKYKEEDAEDEKDSGRKSEA
mmetsp:Transcript_48272/g.105045  ORF Transcript_48272/g.105045 Transcript_48272/m.105045 type:complete len:495 (+) Transcript_48272:170-1654(+)